MNFIRLCTALCAVFAMMQSAGAAVTYYIDSENGSNDAAGTSSIAAWENLSKINLTTFQPGDSILFKCGGSWVGQLRPLGSGSAGSPIVIDTFGTGPLPVIDGNNGETDGSGTYIAVVYLYNQQYWEINNLEITHSSTVRTASHGIWARNAGGGLLHHVYVRGCYIHHIKTLDWNTFIGNHTVDETSQKTMGGIKFTATGNGNKWSDVLVEGNTLLYPGRSGITTTNVTPYADTGIVIRGNMISFAEGDGIIVNGATHPRIEYNTAANNGGVTDYSVAMWDWNCRNAIFQYNECYGTHDPFFDGNAFDPDMGCVGTTFQYNYSHDNEGGFMLMMVNGEMNMINTDITVRYNISQNDQDYIIRKAAALDQNFWFYNNTVYVTDPTNTMQLLPNYLYNNIIIRDVPDDTLTWDIAGSIGSGHNLYFGPGKLPLDTNSLYEDPMLRAAGSGDTGRTTVDGYQLAPGSPCLGAGRAIENPPMPDDGVGYWGNPLPNPPNIGAYQGSAVPVASRGRQSVGKQAPMFVKAGGDIAFEVKNPGAYTAELVRLNGQAVLKKEGAGPEQGSFSMPVPGQYFLRVITGTQTVERVVVVKG